MLLLLLNPSLKLFQGSHPVIKERLFAMSPTLPPTVITNEEHSGHWNLHLHMFVVTFCPDTVYVFFPWYQDCG